MRQTGVGTWTSLTPKVVLVRLIQHTGKSTQNLHHSVTFVQQSVSSARSDSKAFFLKPSS